MASKKTKGIVPTLSPKPKANGRRLHVRADLASGGSLSVRSMSDNERPVHLESVQVSLSDKADDSPKWIQIAKPGVFKGHPSGPFELNAKVFADIIRNFNASTNKRVPIDFEHASEMGPTEGSIPTVGAPAQGWFLDMKTVGENLWGLVKWGSLAREYILDEKYKFFSPAIRFNSRDRVTGANVGARLTSGALTNSPFLDGLCPLVASDGAAAANAESTATEREPTIQMGLAHSPCEYMPRIRRILRMNELATASECLEQLGRLAELLDESDGDPHAKPQGIDIADPLFDLRYFLNSPPGTTWEGIFATVEGLIRAAAGMVEVEVEDDDEGPESASMRDVTTLSAGDAGQTGASAEETTMTLPNDLAAEHTKTVTLLSETKSSLVDTTTKLSDATTKLTETSVKLTASEAKAAELALSLKDETGKREALETELKTLRDEKVKRDEEALSGRVDDAFETYKDTKKLSDDDKDAMLIVLKANPEKFEKLYPKVAKSEQHLLHNLSDNRKDGIPNTSDRVPVTSVREAALRLSHEKGIPLAQAQRMVYVQAKR